MKTTFIDNLVIEHKELKNCKSSIIKACQLLIKTYKQHNKLLICGNGGSASDANHIVAELMKDFCAKRPICPKVKQNLKKYKDGSILANKLVGALPAISLCNESSLMTALANDTDPNIIFAQQVYGLGNKDDVLLAISTSGNAKNVHLACMVAKAKGMKVIGLTGKKGGCLKDIADITIKVDLNNTYKIQELHLPIYHAICLTLEKELF